MGEQGKPDERPAEQVEQVEQAEKTGNKAKLVFGDPLDRQSSDDTDRGWGEGQSSSGSGRGLDWYLSQRPPHHG